MIYNPWLDGICSPNMFFIELKMYIRCMCWMLYPFSTTFFNLEGFLFPTNIKFHFINKNMQTLHTCTLITIDLSINNIKINTQMERKSLWIYQRTTSFIHSVVEWNFVGFQYFNFRILISSSLLTCSNQCVTFQEFYQYRLWFI